VERKTPILDMLKEYIEKDTVRFHMPGHKGDAEYFGGELLKGDITELGASDNLLKPEGVIFDSQELHAERTGAAHSFYSVNGSSAGVMAMLHAAVKDGEKVLMARDIHLSAVNALSLTGAVPVFLDVGTDPVSGLPGAVSIHDMEKALKEHADVKAVYVTYPNYFGLCADLNGIAALAHEAKIPLLVDAAHAAHFPYSPLMPDDPAKAGADAWCMSAHKTLPAMNQCATVNLGEGSLVDAGTVKHFLNMFTTTSPSYPLLASLDYASAYMAEKGNYELYRIVSLTERFTELAEEIKGLQCVGMEIIGRANIADKDILKLTIDVSGRNITGFMAKQALEASGIYIETADLKHILLIVTVADNEDTFNALLNALQNLPEGIRYNYSFSPYLLPDAEFYISPKEALWCKMCKMPFAHAAGFAAARAAGVYPPGIPCLMPGQIITKEIVTYLTEAMHSGFEVFGVEDNCLFAADI
jgi:arginine/lysine/ornithine decarboxylase